MQELSAKYGKKVWKLIYILPREMCPSFVCNLEQVDFLYADVSSHTNYEAAFDKCVELFGGIDLVVNNAGLNGDANWETMLNVNLKGPITGCKLGVKYMGKNRGGKGGTVINIASVQGLVAFPMMPAYSAGKAGIVQYTRY